jgi:hypothetical protein
MGYKLLHFVSIFNFLTMFNTIAETGAVVAGAASRYGSGSDQKMQLLAAPAPQHWLRLQQYSNVHVPVKRYAQYVKILT